MLHCFLIIAFAFRSASTSLEPLFKYCSINSAYSFLARSSVNSLYFLSLVTCSPAPFISMYSCLQASHESSKNSVWTGHFVVLHHRVFPDLWAAFRCNLDAHYSQNRPRVFQPLAFDYVLCHL